MEPLLGNVQLDEPVLQAMPSSVSLADCSQMEASSLGNSRRSSARKSGGNASQAARLAAKIATPQVTGIG